MTTWSFVACTMKQTYQLTLQLMAVFAEREPEKCLASGPWLR